MQAVHGIKKKEKKGRMEMFVQQYLSSTKYYQKSTTTFWSKNFNFFQVGHFF